MPAPIRVSLSVTSDDPDVVTRAVEAMARTVAGLAMEGVDTFLMAGPDDQQDTP